MGSGARPARYSSVHFVQRGYAYQGRGGIRYRQSFSGRGSVSVPAQNNHGSAVGRGLAPAEACQSNQTPDVGVTPVVTRHTADTMFTREVPKIIPTIRDELFDR